MEKQSEKWQAGKCRHEHYVPNNLQPRLSFTHARIPTGEKNNEIWGES